MSTFDPRSPRGLALVGVLHLLALPGSPEWAGDLAAVRDRALFDAAAYADGGMQALIIENFGDRPFSPGAAPPATVAALTVIALAVKERFGGLPLGINVLRNDARAALAIAVAVGAAFIRVNVLVSAMVTDQGLLEGQAWDLALDRRMLGTSITVWGDVMVKHAAPLGAQRLEDQATDAFERGGASALILSGSGTGKAADPEDFRRVRRALPDAPLVVGSGLSEQTLGDFAGLADAAIVATALHGDDGCVDVARVRRMVQLAEASR